MDIVNVVSYLCAISLGVIIVFGVIGNTLSLVVWSTGSCCSVMSCGYYFRLLAIADLFSLLVSGITMLLEISPANIILYNYSDFLCKFLTFSAHLGVQLSSWLVVSVTIERTLSIKYPMKFYHSKPKNRALCVFCLISIVAVILDFMPLWLYEVQNVPVFGDYHSFNTSNANSSVSIASGNRTNRTKLECVVPNINDTFYRTWNLYISFGCFVVGLPPFIITVSNILTITALRQQMNSDNVHKNKRKYSTSISFTYLVIIISVINCISTLPVGYLYIQSDYFNVNSSPVFYRVSLFLFFLNNGTNVILYCLIGKAFRHDLKQLVKSFCCKFHSEISESVVEL